MPKQLTYEFVKNHIESKGYKLLSTKYEGIRKPLIVECENKHQQELSYDIIKGRKISCKICEKDKKIIEFEMLVKKRNHIMLDSYIKNKIKLTLKCPEGHIFKIRPNDFQQGVGCMLCRNEKLSKLKMKKYTEVKEYIELFNYKLLSKEYKGVFVKLDIQCDKGHIFKMKFSNFKNSSQRCPVCSREMTTSKGEKELVKYVSSIYEGTIIENDRTQIINPLTGRYLELDIWMPELKKAIEYNGLFWHDKEEAKCKDELKLKYCENNNIDLLIINDEQWKQNKHDCVEKVSSFIGSLK